MVRGSWVGELEKFHSGKPPANCEIIMTHDPTLTYGGGQNQLLGPLVRGAVLGNILESPGGSGDILFTLVLSDVVRDTMEALLAVPISITHDTSVHAMGT